MAYRLSDLLRDGLLYGGGHGGLYLLPDSFFHLVANGGTLVVDRLGDSGQHLFIHGIFVQGGN